MELVEHHLDVSGLPGRGGSPFTVVVTMDLEALRTGVGAGGVETGERVSAGEVRRLACVAGVVPMVVAGGSSVPLDLGRRRRLFTWHQRLALMRRDGGCAVAGCDRPPGWGEVHHLNPWSAGGGTDLANGVVLCPRHHTMADHPATWDLTRHEDDTITFHRRQ